MSPKHRAADAEQASVDLRFVTQGLSPEEVAAATAVLTAALQQQAQAANALVEPERPSAWSRSTRGLRRPLRGDWRGFTAEGL
ncbi:acyl-CoA carboxylase epsilon subunit [Gryllotalpicola koreensis]|uniref:Acyl-CoA carboxylase subunit epsilon n=1 Tax=Gryllotalpicola koreensis TaxID=993086 RepID=A0ABP8A1M4_9MICO